jgi:hypothetical protein
MSRHPDDIRRTHYEWAIETVYWDEDEGMQDIEDSNYWDKLSDYQPGEVADALAQKRFVREDGIEVFTRLCLMRDVGCEAEGLEDRQYAYVVDGVLPETFDEGAKVPARFRKELAKFTGTP